MFCGGVGIVPTNPRTLLSFGDRSFERLAHLKRHDFSKLVFLGFKKLGGPGHHRRATFKRGAPVSAKRFAGSLQFLVDLIRAQFLETFQSLACAWID
jgi:hypothetical protein